MAKKNIKSGMTKDQVRALVRKLPGILSGRLPSQYGLHKLFWGAVAFSLFNSIYDAYILKSEGGTDDLGNSWDDLSQHTKAYKRDPFQGGTNPVIARRAKRNKSSGLGLLTGGQHALWKRLFGFIYHSQKHIIGEEEAKKLAGQMAWTRLKELGAQTKWEVFGNRNLLILRNTDRLSHSLFPGRFDPDSGYKKSGKDQVFIVKRGSIEMGSAVPYANVHNKTRPIWPEEMDAWLDKATEAGRDAVYEKLAVIFGARS